MSYASDFKQPMGYSDEEEEAYSEEEYDEEDAAPMPPPQGAYAPPTVGYHPAHTGYNQQGYVPPEQGTPGEGGQYVLATKAASTDSFV